jgi:hypothetical protein
MSKSLLDMMLTDHAAGSEPDAPQDRAAPKMPSYEPADVISAVPTGKINFAEERRVARDLDRQRAEARQKAWQAELAEAARSEGERPVEMCGFKVGDGFDLRRVAADMQGRWVVHTIDPGPAGDFSRLLVARRANGGSMVIKFTEPKLLDGLHNGIVNRLD